MGSRWQRGAATAGAIALLSIAGCGYPTNIASGGSCERTIQCAGGLVCSRGHCTNDLTMFGMGMPVSLDVGRVDGSAADAGDTGPPLDMGPIPDVGPHDAYLARNDAYVSPSDAYVTPNDAYTAPNDAYVAPNDAYAAPNDAYTAPVDMGTD